MKTRGLLLGTLPFVVLFLLLPFLFETTVPKLAVVHPELVQYERRVSASGKLLAANQTAVETTFPLIPKNVLVQEGDTVQAGQVLATVDTKASQSALLSLLSAAGDWGKELLSAYGLQELDLTALSLPENIVATSSGTISDLSLASGTLCYPTQTAAVIADGKNLTLTLDVPESDAEQIEAGQLVYYTASATGNTRYHGVVTNVSENAREVLSGTTKATVVSVEVRPKSQSKLKPGYSASGQIVVDQVSDALSLPYSAIEQDEHGEYVYTVQNGHAVRCAVTLGQEFAYYAEILEGVDEHLPVILEVDAVQKDGMLLRMQQEEATWIS